MAKRKTRDFSFQRFFNPDKFNPLDNNGEERMRSGINQSRKRQYKLLWISADAYVTPYNKRVARGAYNRSLHGRLRMSNQI